MNISLQSADFGMTFTKYSGNEAQFTIPSLHDSVPVTAIGSKAFLSCKSITELTLPESVQHLGDWAFAHMKQLRRLTLAVHPYSLGKDVFLDCPRLTEICLTGDTSKNPTLPFLLASVITVLRKPSLFRPEHAGDFRFHRGWLEEYDMALISFMESADDEGFQPIFYGWFNDEDAETSQRPAYIAARRANKIRLAFNRLYDSRYLTGNHRDILYAYLKNNMDIADVSLSEPVSSRSPVWALYCAEYIQDVRYAHILLDAGCITAANLPVLLPDVTDLNPEAAAIFLDRAQRGHTMEDFFADFTL